MPLGVSQIDHLLVHPMLSDKYLLPSTLPELAISIGTPSTEDNCVLELNRILLIPLSWNAINSLLNLLKALTLPLSPSRSRVDARVMLVQVSTNSPAVLVLVHVMVFEKWSRLSLLGLTDL